MNAEEGDCPGSLGEGSPDVGAEGFLCGVLFFGGRGDGGGFVACDDDTVAVSEDRVAGRWR